MTDRTRLFVRPGLTEFELDDYLVIHSASSQQVFALNPTAAFAWALLSAGNTVAEATSALTRAAGISRQRAQSDVDRIVRDWMRHRLLGPTQQVEELVPPTRSAPLPASDVPLAADPCPVSDEAAVFQILDFRFRFGGVDRELIADIETLFSDLRAAAGGADDPAHAISIRQERDEWRLFDEARLLARCSSREGVIPLVYTFVHMLGYLRSNCFAALHAAALLSGEHCVLMPGGSGNGKSTLTAALVADGMECCTDDLAVLSVPPIRLRAFPARIALKEGAWPLFDRRLPEIAGLRVYARPDGQRVKYVVPRRSRVVSPSGTDIPVTHVVFPRFAVDGDGRPRPIPRAVALQLLANAGYDTRRRISAEWVGAMTAWIRELPCFTLEFEKLDDAVRELACLLDRS